MRYHIGSLSLLLVAACAEHGAPTAPARATADVISVAASEKSATASYTFENRTGQVVNKLVLVFGTTVTGVPWSPFPYTTNGGTLEMNGLALPADKHVQLTVTVEGKNARIASWYWALADGTPAGSTNKGCGTKSDCSEVAAPNALDLVTPVVTLSSYAQLAYCFYFRTPNQTSTVLRSIRSHQPASVLRVNLVFTNAEAGPVGTMSASGVHCGPVLGVAASGSHYWVYTAYATDNEFTLPADDCTGKPLGLVLPPGTYGYVYVLFSNPVDAPTPSYVELSGTEYPAGTAVTPANTFVTYNNSINIPPGYTDSTMTCKVPAGAKFFWMSTYAHQYMEHAIVWDGPDVVLESFDPKNPAVRRWGPPFFRFSTGLLTQRFDYLNLTNRAVTTGPSYNTDEQGVVLSWFFPANTSKLCFDGLGPP
jgi:hypothetical protein